MAWACVNPVPANPRAGKAGNCSSDIQEPPGPGPAEGWRMSSCLSPEVINPSEHLRKSMVASGSCNQDRSGPELVSLHCKESNSDVTGCISWKWPPQSISCLFIQEGIFLQGTSCPAHPSKI